LTGCWALADDSGLEVDALDGAPGLYSARYAPTDHERIHRLLKEMGHTPYRSASFNSAMVSTNGSCFSGAFPYPVSFANESLL
ncbi:MAG: non-canonical purine NTP pyrophosphatase, partial [Microcystis panniformis]